MLLVSSNSHFNKALTVPHSEASGFSLVEGLVAAVIVIVALAGTLTGFNLATSSIRRTSEVGGANLAIDNDISRIKNLAFLYTSCVVASGSVPAAGACDVAPGTANYYFPAAPANAQDFFDACRSNSAGSHITAAFVVAVSALPAPGSGVIRQNVVRDDPNDSSNHLVNISYTLPSGATRLVKVSPVVSAWCG
jgi:type II secretory pathway pseudopilin PulG